MSSLFLRIRVPVVVLALSVLASLLVIDASASEKPAEPAKGAPPTKAGGDKVGGEILDQRTRTSKTFTSDDGRGAVTQLYSGPVHFKGANGDWLEIRNQLKRSGGKLRNERNSYSLELPDRLAGGSAVKVSEGGDWLTFALAGAGGGAAAPNGTAATFADALPGVDVRYSAQSTSVKEDIVLSGPDSPNAVRYAIAGSAGLSARETRSGSVEFTNADGDLAFVLPAPFMYDAAGKTSAKVAYGLDESASGWTLTVRADRDWLNASGRKWPVTVDPTVYFYAPDRDCTLASGAPTTNQCNDTVLKAGKNGTADFRSVLNFNVAGNIPKDAVIDSAHISLLEVSNTHGVTKKIGAYKVTQAWQEGATWNTTNGTTAWTTAGGTHDPSLLGETDVGSTSGWEQWFVTKQVRKWADGSENEYGFLLKDSAASPVNNEVRFASSENATVGNRPTLHVHWWPRGGDSRNDATYVGDDLNDRMGYSVNVGNGNLTLESEDVNLVGTGIDLIFSRYYNSLWALRYGGQFGGGITSILGKDVWLDTSGWPEENKSVYLGDGSFYPFDKNGTSWTQPAGISADLAEDTSTGNMELTYRGSKFKYIFDGGGLTELRDRNGNHVDFHYDVNGNLDWINDTKGNRLEVWVNGDGFITKLQDVSGRQWQYGYGTGIEWNLVKTYTDPEGKVTSYDWDGNNNLLTQITTPGGRVTKFEYHTDGSRRIKKIIRVDNPTAGTGPTTTFNYYSTASPCASGENRTIVTDPRGYDTVYCWNPKNGRVSRVRDQNGKDTDTTYSPFGNVELLTEPDNAVTNPEYNARDMVTTESAPAGEKTTSDYNNSSHQDLVSAFTNEQGTAFDLAYDGPGNLSTASQGSPTNVLATSHRDIGKGLITRIVDGNSNTTTYDYDADDNLSKVTPPAAARPNGQTVDLGFTEYDYDSANRIEWVWDGLHAKPGTAAEHIEYDRLDRTKKTTFADGKWIQYAYDDDGNNTSRTEGTGTTTSSTTSYTYDKLNRLTQESLPGGGSNTMTYDANDNLATLTDAGGTVTYGYDQANLLTKLAEPGGTCVSPVSLCTTFTNTARGQRDVTTYPSGATVDINYDDSDKPTAIVAKGPGTTPPTLQSFTYTYTDGRTTPGPRQTELVQSVLDQANNLTKYSYENPNGGTGGPDRLTRAITNASNGGGALVDDYQYKYDRNSNLAERKSQVGAGSLQTTTFKYNEANQLCWKYNGTSTNACGSTPAGGETYRYDKNGNQTIGTAGRAYTYNDKNQTTAIGGTSATYLGYGQDELVGLGSTTYQNNPLGIGFHTTSGTSTNYVLDPDGDPISVKTGSTRHYYIQDQLGSVTGLINSSGALAATYRYEPYGKLASSTGSVTNQIKYAGGHDTGTGVYHFGARYYDPEMARWTQIDQLDNGGDLREGNRYAYAAADPVNLSDLEGLCPICVVPAIGAGEVLLAGGAAVVTTGVVVYASKKKGGGGGKKKKATGGQQAGQARGGGNRAGHGLKKQSRGSRRRTNDKHTKKRPGAPEKGDKRRPYRRK